MAEHNIQIHLALRSRGSELGSFDEIHGGLGQTRVSGSRKLFFHYLALAIHVRMNHYGLLRTTRENARAGGGSYRHPNRHLHPNHALTGHRLRAGDDRRPIFGAGIGNGES